MPDVVGLWVFGEFKDDASLKKYVYTFFVILCYKSGRCWLTSGTFPGRGFQSYWLCANCRKSLFDPSLVSSFLSMTSQFRKGSFNETVSRESGSLSCALCLVSPGPSFSSWVPVVKWIWERRLLSVHQGVIPMSSQPLKASVLYGVSPLMGSAANPGVPRASLPTLHAGEYVRLSYRRPVSRFCGHGNRSHAASCLAGKYWGKLT